MGWISADNELEIQETVRLFESIRDEFPDLDMSLDRHPVGTSLDLSLDIPRQRGLSFDVNLNLQFDEVFLEVGSFCFSWFPFAEESIRQRCRKEVFGVLSGDYRFVEFYRGKTVTKAEMQKPDGDEWKTVKTWHILSIPLPWRRRRQILQNKPGGTSLKAGER